MSSDLTRAISYERFEECRSSRPSEWWSSSRSVRARDRVYHMVTSLVAVLEELMLFPSWGTIAYRWVHVERWELRLLNYLKGENTHSFWRSDEHRTPAHKSNLLFEPPSYYPKEHPRKLHGSCTKPFEEKVFCFLLGNMFESRIRKYFSRVSHARGGLLTWIHSIMDAKVSYMWIVGRHKHPEWPPRRTRERVTKR